MVEALKYKLRTFGITLDGPAGDFCDNKLVVKNQRIPTPTLNKANNTILYHQVREDQAGNIISVDWIEGIRKLADLFTKKKVFYFYKTGYHFKDIQ